ncbi:dipeptidase PepE [Glaciecola sp. 2405UD65-10]|uniref:dipeptidase PepE n=1 Tax=Glaciecola sp. 2405UD65-10 TaxID=3397244 RepID=UPI003B5C6437
MNVLMLSSSKYAEHDYLAYAKNWMLEHLNGAKTLIFVPYAGVSISWDEYTQKVQDALPMYQVKGIHQFEDPVLAIKEAEGILVGGGNTFNLLHQLYKNALLTPIQASVKLGTPYIGWSAGSNICGQSIRTTNDMPIIEPASFNALHFLSAQLNPHYTDYVAPHHHGETRDQRIEEFCVLHPKTPVIAIREGTALLIRDNKLSLLGELNGFVFIGPNKLEITSQQDLTEYL